MSPHDPKVVYFGSNVLFKTTDGGFSWTAISPDLTTNDPEKQRSSGGITTDNVGQVLRAGAVGVAVISSILASPDPGGAARRMKDAMAAWWDNATAVTGGSYSE